MEIAAVLGVHAVTTSAPLLAEELARGLGIRCVTLNYDTMRGIAPENTLS